MKRVPIIHSISAFLLIAALSFPAAAQTPSPTDFVRAKVDELLLIVHREAVAGTEAFIQRQEDLKSAVRNFIDFTELCRRALGRHWDDQTPEAQVAFVELMTRLTDGS